MLLILYSFFLFSDDIINKVFYYLYMYLLMSPNKNKDIKYIDYIMINPRIDLKRKRGLLSLIGNMYPLNGYDEILLPSRIYPSDSYYDQYNNLLVLKLYSSITYSNLIFQFKGINTEENIIKLVITDNDYTPFTINKPSEVAHILLQNINIYLYSFQDDPILADIIGYYIKNRQKISKFSTNIYIKTKNDLKNIKRVEMIINPDPIIKTI